MPNAYIQLATAITRLAEVVFATRESAYNRKLDKRQVKAIQCGENGFKRMNTVFRFIYENIEIPEDKQAEFNRLKELVYKSWHKFDKYD